ncbi:glycosyltransferase family 4 protein [Patescibacteria group bacterium]
MHICILADPIDNQKAGVHVYTKKLIQNLLKIDYKNNYSFIHLNENKFFKGTKNFVITRKKIPGYGTYRKFFLIPNLLKKLNPDIVIETMHIGPFRTSKNSKRAVIIHDLTPILFPEFHIKRSTIIHKLFLRRVIKNADLIICPSENTKKDILNYQETKANIEIVPPGIDKPNNTKLPSMFAKPYLLFLGTIEPRKNLGILIDAFRALKKEQQIPHRLILAGEIGWKSKKIIKKANHKHIHLTGYVNQKEKNSLLQNANIFIYPSFYEGFGIPPMEALSYGIPTICSTGGSLNEIFSDHCLMFEPNDKKTLKKQILKLIKNKTRNYIKNPILKFTWEKNAQKFLEVIESV